MNAQKPARVPSCWPILLLWALTIWTLPAQSPPESTNRSPSTSRGVDPVTQIREEGMNHSQVMQTLSYLTEVIGPRLTGSPQMRRANEWTRDMLAAWGLTNAALEPWGQFGRGWTLQRFSMQVFEPQAIPILAHPKAWTPGLDAPVTADVVFLDVKKEADLEKYQGQLKGKIVLASPLREIRTRGEPIFTRLSESNLLRLANASASSTRRGPQVSAPTNAPASTNDSRVTGIFGRTSNRASRNTPPVSSGSTNVSRAATNAPQPAPVSSGAILRFLMKEQAALVLTPSSRGEGNSLIVESASLPGESSRTNNNRANQPRIWATNAPATLPQVAVGLEDYNRLVRMVQQGEKLKMTAELKVQFHDEDLVAYNTIAEIPGTDLKEEIVMIGAHLDSWHSGTGATDNGAGVAATMEAVRILQALDLKPRRTIRIALWSGEEQGILGSSNYVAKHFGYYTTVTNAAAVRSPRAESNAPRRTRSGSTNATTRKLIKARDYENFSAYYNLDNGTGRIRGVYMQGNEGVRPLFRSWLQPFSDLGAETLTAANTGGTDHIPFDRIGLPGFQFIQDPIEYFTRTHHSNADVYDRIQADDMKQASTVMAAFLWRTATHDEKLPRKTVE